MDPSFLWDGLSHPGDTDRIFATGIEYRTPISQIYDLFSQYGQIIDISEVVKRIDHKPLDMQKWTGEICSGSCSFLTSDARTAKRILDTATFSLNKRIITCAPFKSGRALQIENMERNGRKVLLKKVSSHIPESHIKAIIENMFGPVETFYAFETDHYKGKSILKGINKSR